ncbi:hypothetical protein JXB01_00005, partial [Candidatus Micrarchaeota archaeon]|nr:hypothetical protein [Candidatus Micrarchaeota archaeon]
MDAKLRKKEIRKLRKAGRKERWERFKEYSKRAAKAIKETAVIGVSSVAFALVIGCGAISDNKPVDPLKDKDVQEDKFNYSEVEADVLPEGLYYKDEEQGDVSEVETEDLYGDGPEADEETGETEIEEPFCGPIATSNGLTITGTPELIQNIETPMESYFDKEIVVDEKLIYNPEGMDWTETETVSVSGKNIYDSAENMVATEFSEITYGVEFTNELGNGIPVCSNGMAECSEELKNENMGIEIQLMGNYWIITEMDSENGQLKLGQ